MSVKDSNKKHFNQKATRLSKVLIWSTRFQTPLKVLIITQKMHLATILILMDDNLAAVTRAKIISTTSLLQAVQISNSLYLSQFSLDKIVLLWL